MNFAIAATTAKPPASVGVPADMAEHRKLTTAAQQFEGMLLQEMLKPMKDHGFGQQDREDEGDEKDDSAGFGDTLSSYGVESLATAIAKSGGLGIAKRVVAQVEGEKSSRHPSAIGKDAIPK